MIVVVPVDPMTHGSRAISDGTGLTEAESSLLGEAATIDVLHAVANSGGDLLLNYREAPELSEGESANEAEDQDASVETRRIVRDALGDHDDVRFERQVGSSRAARVGNTVTHLLREEGAASVGVLEPTAPLVARTDVDGAAMSLRRKDVTLGPTGSGDVFFAGFSEPIDFEKAYAPPTVSTLAQRTADAGLDVGFVAPSPTIVDEGGLVDVVARLDARAAAGKPGGEATRAAIEELGLSIDADGSLAR